MAFIAVYDACVLYPNYLRDILIRIARTDIVRARWSDEILDEAFNALRRNRPDLDVSKLNRTRELLCAAVDDSLVSGYSGLIPSLDVPDADDRHVLAAAITAGAQVIVTYNVKDFPNSALQKYNVEALHPDDFIVCQIDIKPGLIVRIIAEALEDYRNPTLTIDALLETYEAAGLIRTAARLRDLMVD